MARPEHSNLFADPNGACGILRGARCGAIFFGDQEMQLARDGRAEPSPASNRDRHGHRLRHFEIVILTISVPGS
jgi:hypothetical protein